MRISSGWFGGKHSQRSHEDRREALAGNYGTTLIRKICPSAIEEIRRDKSAK